MKPMSVAAGRGGKRDRGSENKTPVVALIQREGEVRSAVMERLTGENLKGYIKDNVEARSTVMADELGSYRGVDQIFVKHGIIKHSSREYVRGDVHTNTAEGFFSILQEGDWWHLPSHLEAPPSPILGGIRFPLQLPAVDRRGENHPGDHGCRR